MSVFRVLPRHIELKEMNSVLSCFDIANYFIWLANETGSFVSNLKLQKLVYYAQAWHLAIHEIALFEEDFEAWIHGPVIPVLYQKYKQFSWHPIDETASLNLSENVKIFLDDVSAEYFACDAYELEQMTHIEDPWKKARVNLLPDVPSNEVIQKEWMKEYYGARVEET
jgi:uncharacterized phage-associated protein